MTNKTFAIIKPDAVAAGNAGKILSRITSENFEILGMRLKHLSRREAEGFYAIHKERPFFRELVDFMTSGKCIVLALKKENAVEEWRKLIGATDPAESEEGTIRKQFATNKGQNAVHGSDSDENATTEIGFFFSNSEL